jgi:hypothetical protein
MANEQYPVVGDQNNLMTAPGPGAAVANSLQAILAQRRAQQQEDLINSINQKKTDIEQQQANTMEGYRKEQADTNKFNRESQAQARADAEARRQRFGAAIQSIGSQTVPAPNPMNGPVDPTAGPTDSTAQSQAPVPMISQMEPGTAQAIQLLQALGPDDPNAGPLVQTLLGKMMSKPESEEEPEVMVDDATKKAERVMVPDPKDPTHMIPHMIKRGSPSHFITKQNENGSAGAGQVHWMDIGPQKDPTTGQETGKRVQMSTAGDYRVVDNMAIGPKTPHDTPIVPDTEATKLAALRGKGVPVHYPEFWKPDFTPDPKDAANYKQALENVMGRAHVTQDVMSTIRDVEERMSDKTVPEIIAQIPPPGTPGGFKDETEHNQFVSLLHIVRGQ